MAALSRAFGRLSELLCCNWGKERKASPCKAPCNYSRHSVKSNPGNNFARNDSNDEEAKSPKALSTILSRRLQILKDAIEEIDRQIEQRKKLTGHFREQIDSEIEECQSFLGKLPYPWSEGFVPKMEFIRISLHKSLLTRRKDKRSEELSFWEDLTGLIKEKRKLMMEYEEIKNAQEKLS